MIKNRFGLSNSFIILFGRRGGMMLELLLIYERKK